MKKRILCAILSLAAVFSLIGFNETQAWYSKGGETMLELKAGSLDYTASGSVSLEENDVDILPGTELNFKEAILITNNSTIDTELRVVVDCAYEGEDDLEWDNSWIEFVFDESENWEQEGKYIYYRPNGNSRIPGIEIPETTTEAVQTVADGEETETTTRVYASNEIQFAGKIRISQDVTPEFRGKSVKFNFVIQAKQADIMLWSDFVVATE